MTRVALYARYSSENQKESSIIDQFRNCEQRAAREGWTITARYEDKAISGTTTDRPGYQRMLMDAKAKQFDILLVDDFSRLSRDSMESEHARRRLVHWGVRLIGVTDGIDTAAKGHKMMAGFKGIINAHYIDDLRDKTRRGLEGQALQGFSCGGRTYGYRPVPLHHPTHKDRYGKPELIGVTRVIDDEQAQVVRRIFSWYAEGHSPRWIAGELNRLGIPAPGATYKRTKRIALHGTWSASVIHGDPKQWTGLLHNPLYIGQLIWNRREWVCDPETGRKVPRLRPEAEWIRKEMPNLRIVDQALWDRVQARQQARPKMQKGTPVINVKYLLSGLLKCGICGSNFVMASYHHYACAGRLNRGTCTNELRVRRDLVEAKCLDGLRRELLTPERVTLFMKETTRLLTQRSLARGPEMERDRKRLAKVEQDIANIMTAIKAGVLTVTTKTELEKAESERTRLAQAMQKRPDTVVALLPRLKDRYEAVVKGLSALPQRHLAPMREQIRELVGEIKLVPTAQGYLEAELVGRYEGLLKLAVGTKNTIGCGGRI